MNKGANAERRSTTGTHMYGDCWKTHPPIIANMHRPVGFIAAENYLAFLYFDFDGT